MSKIAEKIDYWYRHNIWTKTMVHMAVEKGSISAAEYKEITGETYNG